MIKVYCDKCRADINSSNYVSNITVQEAGSNLKAMYGKKVVKEGNQRTRIFNLCDKCTKEVLGLVE